MPPRLKSVIPSSFSSSLTALVSEDAYLAIPYRMLCREDCKGLCPRCGKNLNEGPCGCSAPGDPRLAVLAQLLEDTQDE